MSEDILPKGFVRVGNIAIGQAYRELNDDTIWEKTHTDIGHSYAVAMNPKDRMSEYRAQRPYRVPVKKLVIKHGK